MTDKNKENGKRKEIKLDELENMELKSDERFDMGEKKDDKEKKEPEKFGGKRHKKNIKRENRLKKISIFVNNAKRLFGDVPIMVRGFSRFLDYTLNLASILTIIYCIYCSIISAHNGEIYKTAGFLAITIVLVWFSEKIS